MIAVALDRDEQRLFDHAVAHTRWKIDTDAAAHPGPIARFLRVATRRFLHHDATVEAFMREARIDRNALHPAFHRDLGIPPWRYIRERRFDIAGTMLAQTKVEVWKVGCLVGYPDARTFSRAFKRIYGNTPAAQAGRRSTTPA